jgi:hypothetical protein
MELVDDRDTTYLNTPVTVCVKNNDSGIPEGSVMTAPTATTLGGMIVITTEGCITYTPPVDYVGDDNFNYIITTPDGRKDSAKVTIVILAPSDLKILAVDDEFEIDMNEEAEGSIIVNDINPVGEIVITTTPVVSPLNGDVTIKADGTMVYTPDAGYSGIDSFTYRICNSIVPTLCDEAVVTIYITDTDTITPPPLSTCEEFIPNGFSPNDDGINDLFEIIQVPVEGDTGDGICEDFYIRFPSAKIEIYNRWGNLVYEKEAYGNIDQWGPTEAWWNGRSTNGWTVGGDKLPSATYFYILYFNNGGKEPKAGTIFLNN